MADETKRVDVIMGPYRNTLLTMPAAEADAAIAAHWAREVGAPYGDHEPLTEEERAAAMTSADAWAKAQIEGVGATPEPGGTRAMSAGSSGTTYRTRATPAEK